LGILVYSRNYRNFKKWVRTKKNTTKVVICAWRESAESRDVIAGFRREAVVSGYGERFCRYYQPVNSDGVKVDYLEMPLESPRHFPPQPYVQKSRTNEIEFFYKTNRFQEQFKISSIFGKTASILGPIRLLSKASSFQKISFFLLDF